MVGNDKRVVKVVRKEGPLGWVLFTAYIGAVVYFYKLDPTFWGFILAIIKAIVWPAFVIYHGMVALGV
jgi:hypothetical protein